MIFPFVFRRLDGIGGVGAGDPVSSFSARAAEAGLAASQFGYHPRSRQARISRGGSRRRQSPAAAVLPVSISISMPLSYTL